MKALVYLGPGKKALEERPKPEITAPSDAIVKITKTTICGTDLHILKGDVPSCQPGHDEQYPAEPFPRVCLQPCQRTGRCRITVSLHGHAYRPDLGERCDGLEFTVGSRQRPAAAAGQTLVSTATAVSTVALRVLERLTLFWRVEHG